MITLYITNLHTNHPNNEVLDIIKITLQSNTQLNAATQKEVVDKYRLL
jgi:hypothetical protein